MLFTYFIRFNGIFLHYYRFNGIFLFFIVNKPYLLNRIKPFCLLCRITLLFLVFCCFILHSFFVVNHK